MSFLNRLSHSLSSKRLTVSGNKELYTALLTAEPCLVQPLSEQASQSAGIAFTKGFRAYLQPSADVLANDQVTISGEVYTVHGIKLHNYGSDPHKRALLELKV